MQNNTNSASFADTKKHYQILDGLRGVASIMVVCFHLFEAHAWGKPAEQIINHGYLGVDFFFLLSGYVVGYAYDDRWISSVKSMSIGEFFKRRLIRLQPMIIVGMIIGAVFFYLQDFNMFPLLHDTSVWKMLLILVIGMTLLPVPVSMDIRGMTEMHPLNGAAWSLLFEYIANILYALFVRKFSNTAMAILVIISGGFLIHLGLTTPYDAMVGGWSLEPMQVHIGFTRLMYPFFTGLLLSRMVKPGHIKKSFLICTLLIIVIFSFPHFSPINGVQINGLYDALCIILLFPLVVYLGASGEMKGKYTVKVSKFLGDISYPIYITHYPLMLVYTGWVVDNKLPMSETWPYAIAVLLISIVVAYTSLKLYDEPVRKWLTKRFMGN